MSYVEVRTEYGKNIELSRGASAGTIVVEINSSSVFFDSSGVNALREFISKEIEKGWIK